MSKGKIFMVFLSVALLAVLFAPHSQAWPTSDGAYYVMDVAPEDAPDIDGEIGQSEWNTDEEFFQESYQPLDYTNYTEVVGLTLSVVMLRDAQNNDLYMKVTWENTVTQADQPNSIGIAFSDSDPTGMQQTYDRKVAYFDGQGNTELIDLFGCTNVPASEVNVTEFCSGYNFQPGVPDTIEPEFDASFGFDQETEKPYFEFRIPMDPTNGTEDFAIDEGTVIELVANPFDNIAANEYQGHGNVGSNPLVIQFEPRCFFCQPGEGMPSNAQIFNGFFTVLISGIFLALLFAGRSEAFASKLWKVEVSEDMAKESVIMEMAYYNSSFISILITVFFMMYSLIGLVYGIWAQWDVIGYILNGVPLGLGIITLIDLIKRNKNPQEMDERPGVDVQDAEKFWLVPTLFLAITLLMLVFIGIDVIAA